MNTKEFGPIAGIRLAIETVTLRDYFAGKALTTALMANTTTKSEYHESGSNISVTVNSEKAAALAYAIADAMLAERAK